MVKYCGSSDIYDLGSSVNSRIRELIDKHNLGAYADELVTYPAPSIRIDTQSCPEEKLRIGQSKFGGAPDLPQDILWPEYNGAKLAFVAQINLAETSKFDVAKELPAKGMLYFFFHPDQGARIDDIEGDKFHEVIFERNPEKGLERQEIPAELFDEEKYSAYDGVFETLALTFSAQVSLPDTESIQNHILLWERKEVKKYYGFTLSLFADKYGRFYNEFNGYPEDGIPNEEYDNLNGLLGYPDLVQGHLPFNETFPTRLLFQISSVGNMTWADMGRLYFTISDNDLKAGRFEKCRAEIQW